MPAHRVSATFLCLLSAVSGAAWSSSMLMADDGGGGATAGDLAAPASDLPTDLATSPDMAPIGMPITALPEQWTWVDFPDAVCGNGQPTGLGVQLPLLRRMRVGPGLRQTGRGAEAVAARHSRSLGAPAGQRGRRHRALKLIGTNPNI